MAKKHSIIVGLDIGTSKICSAVGEMTEHGVEIIGIGLAALSQGNQCGQASALRQEIRRGSRSA